MKLEIYCSKHPKYTAKRQPTTWECYTCWLFYRTLNGDPPPPYKSLKAERA